MTFLVMAGLYLNFFLGSLYLQVLTIGLLLDAAGLAYLSTLQVSDSYLSGFLPGILCVATGLGLAFVPLTMTATSAAKPDDQGLASGIFNTSRQVGGTVGLAVLAAIASTVTANAHASSHAVRATSRSSFSTSERPLMCNPDCFHRHDGLGPRRVKAVRPRPRDHEDRAMTAHLMSRTSEVLNRRRRYDLSCASCVRDLTSSLRNTLCRCSHVPHAARDVRIHVWAASSARTTQ